MSPTPTEETAPPVPLARKRPRLDMAAALGGGERKRGKSMFGVLLNTLNKAKAEDKERNASEAVSNSLVLHHIVYSYSYPYSGQEEATNRPKAENEAEKGN